MATSLEPLSLFGEGNYALSVVKEIDGTEAFLKLDEKTKLCQNIETFEDCQTQILLKNGLKKCKCTPFMLRNYSTTQVHFIYKHIFY